MTKQDELHLLRNLWAPYWLPNRSLGVFGSHPLKKTIPTDVWEHVHVMTFDEAVNYIGQVDAQRSCIKGASELLAKDWPQLVPEHKARILALKPLYPRELRWVPDLSTFDRASLRVPWSAADSVVEDARRASIVKLADGGRGLDLDALTLGDDGWKVLREDFYEAVQSVVQVRVDADLAAVLTAAPQYRQEFLRRIEGRAHIERSKFTTSIGLLIVKLQKEQNIFLQSDKAFAESGRRNEEAFETLMESLFTRNPTAEIVEKVTALAVTSPAVDLDAPKKPTRIEKWKESFQNNLVGAALIGACFLGAGVTGLALMVKAVREAVHPSAGATAPGGATVAPSPRPPPHKTNP